MMNTKWWSLLFLLTGLVSLSLPSAGFRTSLARVSPVSISVQAGSLKPAEMQADFDLMRKALEEAHTGLYRYSTTAEMKKIFDSQRAKLTKEMTAGSLSTCSERLSRTFDVAIQVFRRIRPSREAEPGYRCFP